MYRGFKLLGLSWTSHSQQHDSTTTETFGRHPEIPNAQNETQLQQFLGTLNWIREYVPRAAQLTKPFTHLLQKGEKFRWTDECQQAFDSVKEAASKPLVLHRPDPTLPYYLQTDASQEGLGAVLYQETPEGNRQVISYASSTLNKTEARYHVNELEALAVVWAVKRYATLLSDVHFVLRTDNRSVLWLHKNSDSRAKLTRWSLMLQEYSFDIEHCPGKTNQLPDLLSRYPEGREEMPDSDDERMTPPILRLNHLTQDELYRAVKQAQQESRQCIKARRRWRIYSAAQPRQRAETTFLKEYHVQNNLLWKVHNEQHLLVVPKRLTLRVIGSHHDTPDFAHPGREETLRQIRQTYHWRRMSEDVAKYVYRCRGCLAAKPVQRQPDAPQRAHTPQSPFEMLSIDILGPYQETRDKNKYIIAVEDVFSKWVEAIPVPAATTPAVIRYLEHDIIPRYGPPKTIISDNGPVFRGRRYEDFAHRNQIRLELSAIYHQQANPIERRVQEIKKTLRALMGQTHERNWDKYLSKCLYVLRTRKNAATGESPSKIVLGYELPKPGQWKIPTYLLKRSQPHRVSNETIQQRQSNYQQKYHKPDQQPKVTFRVGDRVMTRNFVVPGSQFAPAWTGPHPITRCVSDVVYEVERDGRAIFPFHVNDLRPAPEGNDDVEIQSNPESDSENEDDEEAGPAGPPQPPHD
jgi:Integrase core domain.